MFKKVSKFIPQFDNSSNFFSFSFVVYDWIGLSVWRKGHGYRIFTAITSAFLVVYWCFFLADLHYDLFPLNLDELFEDLSGFVVQFMGIYKYFLMVDFDQNLLFILISLINFRSRTKQFTTSSSILSTHGSSNLMTMKYSCKERKDFYRI